MFLTEEYILYLNPPVNNQNNRVRFTGIKRDVDPQSLMVQRAKFLAHGMESAGICYNGKRMKHFDAEKTRINAYDLVSNLLPRLIDGCYKLPPYSNFTLQQDGAPDHTSRLAQEWLEQKIRLH